MPKHSWLLSCIRPPPSFPYPAYQRLREPSRLHVKGRTEAKGNPLHWCLPEQRRPRKHPHQSKQDKPVSSGLTRQGKKYPVPCRRLFAAAALLHSTDSNLQASQAGPEAAVCWQVALGQWPVALFRSIGRGFAAAHRTPGGWLGRRSGARHLPPAPLPCAKSGRCHGSGRDSGATDGPGSGCMPPAGSRC